MAGWPISQAPKRNVCLCVCVCVYVFVCLFLTGHVLWRDHHPLFAVRKQAHSQAGSTKLLRPRIPPLTLSHSSPSLGLVGALPSKLSAFLSASRCSVFRADLPLQDQDSEIEKKNGVQTPEPENTETD